MGPSSTTEVELRRRCVHIVRGYALAGVLVTAFAQVIAHIQATSLAGTALPRRIKRMRHRTGSGKDVNGKDVNRKDVNGKNVSRKDLSVSDGRPSVVDDATKPRYLGPFDRYVAIGDSTTEGLDDPDGNGGFRGWANRFAEKVSAVQGHLLYANLAVRGLSTRQILDTQLQRALDMKPKVSTVVSGTNDVLRPSFDVNAYERDVAVMQRALIDQGAVVLTFTMPDMSRVNPTARIARTRLDAMNAALRDVSASTGAIVVDLAQHALAGDPRLWSTDRLHANALGHARIAAALAHAVHLPGSDDSWMTPLDAHAPLSTIARWSDHAKWGRTHLAPWLLRRMQGRSSADGKVCKRPILLPVEPVDDEVV